MTHIQQQHNKNKIFIENSPERKSHDNMLISPKIKKTKKKQSFHIVNDEANVIEKIAS